MFTGIIEALGTIEEITQRGDNVQFRVRSSIASELKPDQSISHNGVCLTVEEVSDDSYTLTAIPETLQKTTLGRLKPGQLLNLERCVRVDSRLDGHIVQGHVDGTGRLIDKKVLDGSIELSFEFDEKFAPLVIDKGSISLDGISLTLFNVKRTVFSVAIIPYTLEHTNLKHLKLRDEVNLEFDIIGKYINRMQQLNTKDFHSSNYSSSNA